MQQVRRSLASCSYIKLGVATVTMSSGHYEYVALSDPDKQIRLLKFVDDEDDSIVHIELKIYDFVGALPYTYLSYMCHPHNLQYDARIAGEVFEGLPLPSCSV